MDTSSRLKVVCCRVGPYFVVGGEVVGNLVGDMVVGRLVGM